MISLLIDRATLGDIADECRLTIQSEVVTPKLGSKKIRHSVTLCCGRGKVEYYAYQPLAGISNPIMGPVPTVDSLAGIKHE